MNPTHKATSGVELHDRVFPHEHSSSSFAGDMDVMKNSPANGRGTPRDDMPPASGAGPGDMGPYMGPPYQDGVSFGSL